MAKIPFGILGAFIGKAGPIIGKTWKGKPVITSARTASKRDKKPTPLQAVQRSKFGFVSTWLGGTAPLVKRTFRELATGTTEFQQAVSYNMHNAVSFGPAGYMMHYERVSVGRGSLPNAALPEAKAEAGGDIRFIWADNSGVGSAAADDIAIVVLLGEDRGDWHYEKTPVARRSDASLVIQGLGYKGTVHTWLTFVNADGKAADSVYTGAVGM